MIETLLGSLLGGALRLAPEALKVLDRRNERAHELSLQGAALEFEKVRGAQKMGEIGAAADAAVDAGAMAAFTAAVQAQGVKTGVAWADALSSSVRPVLTFAFFTVYSGLKIAAFIADGTLESVWTEADSAMFSGIISFWFVSRAMCRSK